MFSQHFCNAKLPSHIADGVYSKKHMVRLCKDKCLIVTDRDMYCVVHVIRD